LKGEYAMAKDGKDLTANVGYVISGHDSLITHSGNDAEKFFTKLPMDEENFIQEKT
jgi:hypothetical protein